MVYTTESLKEFYITNQYYDSLTVIAGLNESLICSVNDNIFLPHSLRIRVSKQITNELELLIGSGLEVDKRLLALRSLNSKLDHECSYDTGEVELTHFVKVNICVVMKHLLNSILVPLETTFIEKATVKLKIKNERCEELKQARLRQFGPVPLYANTYIGQGPDFDKDVPF